MPLDCVKMFVVLAKEEVVIQRAISSLFVAGIALLDNSILFRVPVFSTTCVAKMISDVSFGIACAGLSGLSSTTEAAIATRWDSVSIPKSHSLHFASDLRRRTPLAPTCFHVDLSRGRSD